MGSHRVEPSAEYQSYLDRSFHIRPHALNEQNRLVFAGPALVRL